MMDELKNTMLIGLTVIALTVAAYYMGPQTSPAQQYVDLQKQQQPDETEDDEQADNPPADANAPGQPVVAVRHTPPSVSYLIGIKAARARLGMAIPTGEGITLGHVEFGPGAYMPNTHYPQFKNVTFVERSGPSKPSGHASATARVIYGVNGLAPGVSVVHCFDSRDWMGPGYLNAGSSEPPKGGPARVITESWIGDANNAKDVLRRVDWQIDTHGTIMCVGVNNGAQTPVPYLLASAYNVIAVGTDRASRPHAPSPNDPANLGGSSGGYTRIEVPGRCKPDIIGPRKLTSFTTPAVAACAARLLQAADEMTDVADRAGKPETIKAVLLAGATKPDNWQPAPGKPLDEHLGAGVVNFNNSLLILQAGPPAPGSDLTPGNASGSDSLGQDQSDQADPTIHLPNRVGWDYRAIEPDQTIDYTFALQSPVGEASIILTWNRRITGVKIGEGPNAVWFGQPELANLDLKLVHTDEAGEQHTLAVSDSMIDNVEHIYLKHLQPGRYHLLVSRPEHIHDEPWDYALAWRVELADNSGSAEED